MRPVIAPLLLLALVSGGCDRQSPGAEQAAGDPAGNITQAAAPAATGKLDRSHKGEAAPDFAFATPDGRKATIAAFSGTPVLVNLWATWCAPCIAEMPTLDALAVREGDSLRVLTISQDLDGAAKVTPFFAARGFKKLEPWLEPDLQFSTTMQANLPTTILYDAQGREVWRVAGGMDWAGAEAAKLIAEAG
ncbi:MULTISPECIES: TlpA family protein disulfide reductase [unclassified Sphingomonas]|uniref:TlpA family protein disulfide reductase n=1 Tax=unclassified Sphingomonas TaxID=196159 RepID=UPI00082A7368|nr:MULTISPECIES: TlpA disulfide reductase family protein [unclassified Sphingomonas]